MSAWLRLDVLSPTKTILGAREVAWVQVQLADGGGLGIYPGHAPLLAETVAAPLRYQDAEGEPHTLMVDAGVLHITAAGVEIFTGAAVEEADSPHEDDQQVVTFDRLAGELLTSLRVPLDEDAGI